MSILSRHVKMFVLNIFILSVVGVEGFRIRRSEPAEPLDLLVSVSDGNTEYTNSDLKNIKLADDGPGVNILQNSWIFHPGRVNHV